MPTSIATGWPRRTIDDRSRPSRAWRVFARGAIAVAVMAAVLVLFVPARADAQCTCPPITPSCPSGCVCSSSPATCGYTQGCGVRCAAGDIERVLGLCAGGTQTQYDCTRSCGTTFTCAACLPGFIGPMCQYSNAVTCSGNGVALFDGSCVCNAGFGGARCNACATNHFGYPTCRFCNATSSCSGHGACSPTGACVCSAGWAGANCNTCATGWTGTSCDQCLPGYAGSSCTVCPGGISNICSGYGSCDSGRTGSGRCTCFSGFTGSACQYSNTVTCNSHGIAQTDGSCICATGFAGERCDRCAPSYLSYPSCTLCNAAATCNGHGSCGPAGTCACDAGYAGAACQYSNSVTCNGHGTARADGSCLCDTGFAGISCDRCASGYFGFPSCRFCDSTTTCGGAGTCTSAGLCACSAGYVSADCSSPVIVSSSLGGMSGTTTLATITGYNFGAAGRVVANGVDALVSVWSDRSISFFVPGACAMVDVAVVRMSDGRSSAAWRLCSAAGDAGAGDASGRGMDVATETDAIVDARDATLGDIGAALEAGSDVAVFDSTSDDADANRVVTADDARSSDSGASEPAQDAATVFDANGTDANTRDAEMTADAGRPPPAGMLCSVDRVCTASARRPALWAMASVVLIASRLRRKRAKSA